MGESGGCTGGVNSGAKVPEARFRALHRNLRLRLAVSFLERFIGSMVTPLVIIYLADRLGALTAGILLFAAVAVGTVASLVSGGLSDRFGRRPVMLLGAVGMVCAFAGMAAGTASWWASPAAVYLFFIVQMVSITSVQPAHEAMVLDITPPEARKLVYSINYWSVNLALAAGAVVGSFAYAHLASLLSVYSGLAAIGALATFLFLKETAPERSSAPERQPWWAVFRAYPRVVADARFRSATIAKMLLLGIEFQLAGYLGVRIAEHVRPHEFMPFAPLDFQLGGVRLVGVLRAENTLLVVLLALLAAGLLRRINDSRRIHWGIALFTCGYASLAVGDNSLLLLVGMAIATLGEIVYVPSVQAHVAELVPEEARSRYMAVFGLNPKGGQVISAACLGLGVLVPGSGMALIFLALGAAALLFIRSAFTLGVVGADGPADSAKVPGSGRR